MLTQRHPNPNVPAGALDMQQMKQLPNDVNEHSFTMPAAGGRLLHLHGLLPPVGQQGATLLAPSANNAISVMCDRCPGWAARS